MTSGKDDDGGNKADLFSRIGALPDAPDKWKRQSSGFLKPLAGVTRKVMQKARPKKELGAANLRVIEAAVDINMNREDVPIAFQHTVLCQTCLPYREQPEDVRFWQRDNGLVSLELRAGRAFHPTRKWVSLGLPFGPKPRQILAYLNTEAIVLQRPVIDVEGSLTGFVKAMGYDHKGQNIKTVKEQIARLAAADFGLGMALPDGSANTHKGTIVTSFNLWCEKDERQRVMWPRTITLDDRYFQSLLDHAVPLDQRAIAALGHSALALDIYAWLAQRLHRVKPNAPSLVGWVALQRQFGEDFARLRKFREKFIIALRAAKAVYPDAQIEVNKQGLLLKHSAPPVRKVVVAGAGSLPLLTADKGSKA